MIPEHVRLVEVATKTLETLNTYRERHIVPSYLVNAMANLRDALSANTQIATSLETPRRKTMGRFRQRVLEVDAIQYDGTSQSLEAVFDWSGGDLNVSTDEQGRIFIETGEGAVPVNIGDWIIKDPVGTYWPCKPDVFALRWEPVYE